MNVLFLNDAPVIRRGLASGFQALGHRVEYLTPKLWTLHRGAQDEEVRCWLERNPAPDIILFEGLTGVAPIYPEATSRFRAAGSQFYYWAIEDPLWSHEVIGTQGEYGPYALVADHVFTTAVECVDRYRSFGRPSSVLQFAVNPDFHRPVDVTEDLRTDIVLIANHYPGRTDALLEHVVLPALDLARERGLRFRLYGHGWGAVERLADARDLLQGPLDYEALPDVYSGTKIALGAEQCLDMSDTQSSMRVFEAMGCGACYLGPRHRAHERMFTKDEIALSASADETRHHLMRLLFDDEARAQQARAGRARCLASHRYAHRAQHVLDVFAARAPAGIAEVATS